ncbi:hypothetical protein [Nocardia brasiliensis]|uniref:hypothetical protein n=1 Tax=Nocardia brasiliensis TaxID=37326 RepID=UPI00366D9233
MDEYTERRAAHIKRLNAAISGVRGSSRSADGGVFVETDTCGNITALHIEPYVLEAGARRLETLIADRHRIAYTNAQAEAERIYTELNRDAPKRDAPPQHGSPHSTVPPSSVASSRWPSARDSSRHQADGNEYVL